MERRRALLIGITIFGEGLDNFSPTLEDVQVMKKCLEEKGGFEVILEENLDRKDMEYVINKFFYESQKSDTLLIYVSSHGITDAEGTFYIATSDTSYDRDTEIITGAIEASYFHRQIKNCTSNSQVWLLDLCYSGAFVRGYSKGKNDSAENLLIQQLLNQKQRYQAISKGISSDNSVEIQQKEGLVIITSSAGDQKSYFMENQSDLSIFTYYAQLALNGDAANEEGKVTVDSFYKFLEVNIPKYVKDNIPKFKYGSGMKPEIHILHGEAYDIVLAKTQLEQKLQFRRNESKENLFKCKYQIEKPKNKLGIAQEEPEIIFKELPNTNLKREINQGQYQQKSFKILKSYTILSIVLLVSIFITTLVTKPPERVQQFKLQAFDQMMRWRPDEGPDKRLLIVTVTPEDIKYQKEMGWEIGGESLSDQAIIKVLDKLNTYKPLVIGLDIFRDFPAKDEHLKTQLAQNKSLIAVCKIKEEKNNSIGIEPPPEIQEKQRIGFADFPQDSGGVIRRQLLGMSIPENSLCSSYSFSLRIAIRYLKEKGIENRPGEFNQGNLKINEVPFHKLDKDAGGYHLPKREALGYQILLNYRSSDKIAETMTLKELLDGSRDSKLAHLVKNKIVLIGTDAAEVGYEDMHLTPYNKKIPGIMIHGHMISQILSAVLDGRTLLWWWPQALENLWIWGWSFIGGILGICWSRQVFGRWFIWMTVVAVPVTLWGICFLVFIEIGGWLPLVPSILGFFLTGITIIVYHQTINDSIFLSNNLQGK